MLVRWLHQKQIVEIDEKHKLLKPGQRVVDLGAAPGGWSEVATRESPRTRNGSYI